MGQLTEFSRKMRVHTWTERAPRRPDTTGHDAAADFCAGIQARLIALSNWHAFQASASCTCPDCMRYSHPGDVAIGAAAAVAAAGGVSPTQEKHRGGQVIPGRMTVRDPTLLGTRGR